MTSDHFLEISEFDLVGAVASTLNLTSPDDVYHLQKMLCPAMLMAAVAERNISKLQTLKNLGVDLSSQNTERRTALHEACADGNLEIVGYLLRHGCSVHVRDRLDRTPLQDAIENDRHQVVKLLVKCGAHMTGSARLIGEQLCLAAARGSIVRLQSYQIAGTDLSQTDCSGRTALHVVSPILN